MADITINLLESINTVLTAKTAAGETLEGIKSFFVKYTESDLPPEIGSAPPVLMVDMMPILSTVLTCQPCMIEKQYPIRFTIFTENAGDTTDNTALTLINLVEDVFTLQGFGFSEWVQSPQKNQAIPTAPPFQFPVSGGASMIITHVATDIRAIPTQGV